MVPCVFVLVESSVNSRFVILLFHLIELDSVCKLKIVSLVLFY